MEDRDTGGEENHTALPRGRPTRRGILRRASALGVFPVSGFTGEGSVERGDDATTATSEGAVADEDSPPETRAPSLERNAAFFRTYQDSAPGRVETFVQTSDGGYAIVGPSGLLRTDARGDPLFRRTYDSPSDLVATDDGGVVVLGNDGDETWLRSVDADGITCWTCEYSGETLARSLIRTISGGYAWITATAEGPAAHVVGGSGETVWQRTYTTDVRFPDYPDVPGAPQLSEMVQFDAGGFALVGRVVGPRLIEQTPIWLVRTDPAGEPINEELYGRSSPTTWNYHHVHDAIPTADGGVAVTGYEGDNAALTTGPERGSFLLTVGLDLENGSYQVDWDGGSNFDWDSSSAWCGGMAEARALVQTEESGFVIAGRGHLVQCWVTDHWGADVGDYAVARVQYLDPEGEVQWMYSHPAAIWQHSEQHVAKDVIRTRDGGFAVLGHMWYPSDEFHVWLAKLSTERSC